jgi:hypothetical protein
MATFKLYFIAMTILVVASSCMNKAKPLGDECKDYCGNWYGENESTITINPDGSGGMKFVKKEGNATSTSNATPANVSIQGDKMFFEAIMGLKFEMKIDQKPSDESGAWTMIVDGMTFTKD